MALALMPRHPLLRSGQVDAVIHPHRFFWIFDDHRFHPHPFAIEDFYQIGEIILILSIVITDFLQVFK